MCLVESGIPPVSYVIAKKMKSFLQGKLQSMDTDEPLSFVYNLCRINNTRGFRFIQKALNLDIVNDPLDSIRQSI